MTVQLSLTMIARDEESTLGRVLAQVSPFCDEMIVVDTGSRDRTRQVAQEAGARVIDFVWIDDFAAARNVSLNACQGDWVLWMDADDVVAPEVQAAISAAKREILTDNLDAITAPYRYFAEETGECTLSFHRERLVRRVPELHWVGAVHEALAVPGTRILHREDLYIEHHPDSAKQALKSARNLRIIERAVQAGDRSPRTLYYYANELRDAGRDANALDVYTAYLQDPGPEWEQYMALISMCECSQRLGHFKEAIESLHAAVRMNPSRAEAFLRLGWEYFQQKEWTKALPFYSAAAAATPPLVGFVSPPDYSWRPWDFIGICFANLDRHEESIAAMIRSLNAGNPDKERLQSNLHWSVKQLL
ncbi:MAG: glycosyltransferase [Candidatus Dormibacteraceae bacterium]